MATTASPPERLNKSVKDEPSLTWTVWPAGGRPGVALLVLVAVLVAAAFAGQLMQSTSAGLLAGLFLVHALRQFFFPTIYRIDVSGVSTRCFVHATHYPWQRIRRFRHDSHGGFLSTRARAGFLDRFSGLHLTWNVNREQAVWLIEGFMNHSTNPPARRRQETAACGTG